MRVALVYIAFSGARFSGSLSVSRLLSSISNPRPKYPRHRLGRNLGRLRQRKELERRESVPRLHCWQSRISTNTGIGMRTLAILFPNTFLTAPSFSQDVLCRRYAQTSKDTLERAGVKEIKLYLIHRAQGSPNRRLGERLRQSSLFGFFKTLQMVYSIDTKRQLQRAIN